MNETLTMFISGGSAVKRLAVVHYRNVLVSFRIRFSHCISDDVRQCWGLSGTRGRDEAVSRRNADGCDGPIKTEGGVLM